MTLEENKDIDNLFKSAIEPYKMDPTEKVWTSMDIKLAKKHSFLSKIKINRLKFISIVATTVVLSFVGYHFLSPSQKADHSVKDNNSSILISSSKGKASNNSSAIDERVKAFFGKSLAGTEKAAASSEEKSGEEVNQVAGNGDEGKRLSDKAEKEVANSAAGNKRESTSRQSGGNDDVEKTNNFTTSADAGKVAANETASHTETANADERQTTSSNSENTSNTKETSATNDAGNAIQTSAQQEGSKENAVTSSTQSESENDVTKTGDAVESKENPSTVNLAKEPEAASTPSKSAVAGSDSAENSTVAAPPVIALNQIKQRFSLDAFYSPNTVSRAMESSNPGNIQNGPTTSSEQFNYSFNTGAMFRFDLSDKWSVSIGCTYSTLNYSTSVTTSYVVPPPADSVHGGGPPPPFHLPHGGNDTAYSHNFNDPNFFGNYFPYSPSTNSFSYNNPCGSIHLHGDPILAPPPSAMPGDVVYFTTNTNMLLQYINIPLTLSFKLSNRRFDYYATAGVSMAVLINQQATVNIADAYSETTSDISGLNKTSYNYLLSAGVRYHLYKGMSIFVEPAYRGAITSITTAPSGSFYPYYFGLNTGISFYFY